MSHYPSPSFPAVELKHLLVFLGLKALACGDDERVALITQLLQRKGLGHV
jgi:hypothetical protein